MRSGSLPPPESLNLSVEEAAILSDETDQEAANLSATLTTMTTTSEVAVIYQDAKAMARDFDNAELLALNDIVTGMGNTLTGSVTVVDYTPTCESIADHVSDVWKKIVELLKKAWGFITNFFQRIFSYRNYLNHRAEELSTKINDLTEEPLQPNPVINVPMRDGKIFTLPGQKLLDTKSFSVVMQDIFKNVRKNFRDGPVVITNMAQAMMTTIESVQPDSTNETLQKTVAEKIIPAFWRYFDAFGVKDFKRDTIDSHITNTFTATSPPLAGSCRVSFTWGNLMNTFFLDRKSDQPIAQVLRDLTIARCHVTQEREAAPSNHLTMPAFKVSGMKLALESVQKGLVLMSELEKAQTSRMEDVSGKFGKVIEDVSKRLDGAAEVNPEARTTLNVMLNLPNVYCQLATQPMTDLTKRTMGTFEAVLNMVEQSIKMYVPKAAKEGSQDFKPAGM
jgi:hypothetical protein